MTLNKSFPRPHLPIPGLSSKVESASTMEGTVAVACARAMSRPLRGRVRTNPAPPYTDTPEPRPSMLLLRADSPKAKGPGPRLGPPLSRCLCCCELLALHSPQRSWLPVGGTWLVSSFQVPCSHILKCLWLLAGESPFQVSPTQSALRKAACSQSPHGKFQRPQQLASVQDASRDLRAARAVPLSCITHRKQPLGFAQCLSESDSKSPRSFPAIWIRHSLAG